jgi:hypothetical protein
LKLRLQKIQYDADGVQRRWSIPFQYADAKHISIYTKVGDEPTVKVVDNYDIDEDDSVVIYPTVASGQEPLTAGTKITIARETPETQLEDASQVHFTSKDVERGLDKLTMITQELSTTASETMEVSADAFEAAEEAVNSAALANRTAEEAKTIAGQAVGIATDAKSIANGIDSKATQALDNSNTAINTADSAKQTAEGIDAKATQALTNSNTAVNTANSAKQTAEGIDGKATQALANSTTALEKATEAKNTADSYQGQITTIESKIPADATEQNKLVTKTQMETAVAGSSGFDFEGTKAEFDAAVAAGTITADSVSLITDDVSGDNIATKAELQDRVSKSGDTMTGTLKMSGQNQIRFGTDDNYCTVAKQSNGNFAIIKKDNKGLFLHIGDNFKPYYVDGTNIYRLLTTADLSQQVNPIRLNYAAQVSGVVVVAPSNGFIFARGSYNDTNYELKVEDPAGTIVFALSIGYNNDGPTCCSVPVTTGQKAYITPGSQVIFVPYY